MSRVIRPLFLLTLCLLATSGCNDIPDDTPEAPLGDVAYAATENIEGFLAHRLSGDARRRFNDPSLESWLRNLLRSHELLPVKGARIDGPVTQENGKPFRTRYWFRIQGRNRHGRTTELGTALVNCEYPKKKKGRYEQCYPVEFRPKACGDRWQTAETMALGMISASLRGDVEKLRTLTGGDSEELVAETMSRIRRSLGHELVVVDEKSPLDANFGYYYPEINVYERVEGTGRFEWKFTLGFSCQGVEKSLCGSGCVFDRIYPEESYH